MLSRQLSKKHPFQVDRKTHIHSFEVNRKNCSIAKSSLTVERFSGGHPDVASYWNARRFHWHWIPWVWCQGLTTTTTYYNNFIFQGTLQQHLFWKQNISPNPVEVRNHLVFQKTTVRQNGQLVCATVKHWEKEKATCICVSTCYCLAKGYTFIDCKRSSATKC